ncbi:PilW family protein [Acetohalobium arabaticum]|uniref:Prepilin-type N-terminal cleavage/methylation domain-containing protein n=1 Tax=Acetohalobium arabaticum (strain ATCC 49924 / DSM 5501 / Z-7288) TaxID=574087 RepID=D9QRX9_ACEAZ|nr:type II secretion system protein [Acetohalobium arabaticum]ADL13270.1 hypothetical protein Acear_1765 [Acetohalobium arabaticum DSM 5501]
MLSGRNQGFTLIEVLIVLAIIGVVSTAISNVLLTGVKVWNFNQQQVDLQQRGRGIMLRLSPEIRKASQAIIKDGSGTQTNNGVRLTLKDDSGNEYLEYLVEDGVLKEKEADWSSHKPITQKIISNSDVFNYIDSSDDCEIAKEDKELIKIKLVLEVEDKTYNLINKVYLRN